MRCASCWPAGTLPRWATMSAWAKSPTPSRPRSQAATPWCPNSTAPGASRFVQQGPSAATPSTASLLAGCAPRACRRRKNLRSCGRCPRVDSQRRESARSPTSPPHTFSPVPPAPPVRFTSTFPACWVVWLSGFSFFVGIVPLSGRQVRGCPSSSILAPAPSEGSGAPSRSILTRPFSLTLRSPYGKL